MRAEPQSLEEIIDDLGVPDVDWMDGTARQSDLGKIVDRQRDGRITRIDTSQMRDAFLENLRTLKAEHHL